MQKIIVASLGQRDERQLTLQALDALQTSAKVILRTGRHQVADYLEKIGVPFETLDDLYETSADFDELNEKAVSRLLAFEGEGTLCYGVKDATNDQTVTALLKSGFKHITLLPGVTQSADTLAAARPALSGGLRTLSAIALKDAVPDPREALLVTELNSRVLCGEVKLWLLTLYAPDMAVHFIHQGKAKTMPLHQIDRFSAYDHTSSVLVPPAPMMARSRYDFQDLVDVLAVLRAENGCPWDREQTHESLRQYLIEEAYEAVAAIDQKDMEHVYDELGDVMLQVVFHANIAKQYGEFDIYDVTSAVVGKMISRHRHIFGDDLCATADDVLNNWESIKKAEKGLKTYTEMMTDIPPSLPALMRASKVQGKAKQAGFDFADAREALTKVYEEARELELELDAKADPMEEMGDLLFACVNVARKLKIQPELCLSSATEKFMRRFSRMENEILLEGKSLEGLTLREMDVYWERGKNAHREGKNLHF